MVRSASCLSRVVTGERMQITTVFLSAADTTLSSSATTAPRISTSSSNVVEGDIHRVIRRDQAPSPNKVLAGSGVGRGTARRPVKQSTGRGQGLAGMLVGSAGRVGRGRSTPSPPVGRSGQGKRRTSTRTKTGLSPAVTMQLDHQGPAVTYSEAASRPPRRTEAPSSESMPGDVHLKLVAREKEKEAARTTLEQIHRQEREEDAACKKREEQELHRARHGVASCVVWREKGPGNRRSTTMIAEPQGLVLTPSPTLWGGVNMSGLRRGHTRVPHGLETYGVPAPCITNSWLQKWSAHGN